MSASQLFMNDFNFKLKEIVDNQDVVEYLNSEASEGLAITSLTLMHIDDTENDCNRNRCNISRRAVELSIPSMKNRPIVARYNSKFKNGVTDVTEHARDEEEKFDTRVVGYIPQNAKIVFEKEDNGKTYVRTHAILFADYEPEIIEILRKNSNSLEVSTELLCKSRYDFNKDITYIDKFLLRGVAILSPTVMPGIEGSKIELLNSDMTERLNSIYNKFMQNNLADFANIDKEEEELENTNTFSEEIVNSQEKTVEVNTEEEKEAETVETNAEEEKEPEFVDNKVDEEESEVENSEEDSKEEKPEQEDDAEEDNSCNEQENVCNEEDNASEDQDESENEENNACEDSDENFASKYDDLLNQFNELENKYNQVVEELNSYKEKERKQAAIETMNSYLNEYSACLTDEQFNTLLNSVETATVEDFKIEVDNKVKEFAMNMAKKQNEETGYGLTKVFSLNQGSSKEKENKEITIEDIFNKYAK